MGILSKEKREEIMKQWDYWRKLIAQGNVGSAPRDWFESVLDYMEEEHQNKTITLKTCEAGDKMQMTEREEIKEEYRKLTLRQLLHFRFQGSYTPGIIEEVIFERLDELEKVEK